MIRNRIFAVTLTLIIILTSLLITTVEANTTTSDGFTFDTETGTITQYSGNEVAVVIPNQIDGATVKIIGDNAFNGYYGSTVTSVTIPDSVISIGASAFSYCTKLENITIPNSVTSIGSYAFTECSGLINVEMPSGIESIDSGVFYDCSGLISIAIPNSVTKIGESAFAGCRSLADITVPNTVTNIGKGAFADCRSLTVITIPNTVISIGDGTFGGCRNLTNIIIPDSVTTVGEYAFVSCVGLKSIIIPDSVISIGNGAFESCSSLESITIPNSVASIGDSAFEDCSSLENITIPNNLKSISYGTFWSCTSLKSIIIPDSVMSIGDGAFLGCSKLTSLTISNSVTSIGDYAFRDCSSLESLIIPNAVTSIGKDVFKGCKNLFSIDVNEGNLKYASIEGVLYNKDLSILIRCPEAKMDAIISSNTINIDSYAFQDCSKIISMTIPDGVTNVGEYAFANCESLISITIPSNKVIFTKTAIYRGGDGGPYFDHYEYKTFDNFNSDLIIYGVKGSETEALALEQHISFLEIGTKLFNDIGDYDWVNNQINSLALKGIIKGTGENIFAPAAQISRADFMILLVRIFGYNDSFNDNFDDVSPGSYYYNEIGIAKKLGLATGIGNNLFEPEAPISRQDMFVLAYRILKQKSLIGDNINNENPLENFIDNGDVSEYAKQALAVMTYNGLMKGSDSKSYPLSYSSRAESAMLVYRIHRILENEIK